MSDRFRFRLWDGERYWHNGFWVMPTGKWGYPIEEHRPESGILEQCTGQKDQAGHLIFEGDVVSVYNPMADAWYDCVVVWEPEAAGYVCRYLEPDKVVRGCAYASDTGTYFEGASCRVIGNIHEWKGGEK